MSSDQYGSLTTLSFSFFRTANIEFKFLICKTILQIFEIILNIDSHLFKRTSPNHLVKIQSTSGFAVQISETKTDQTRIKHRSNTGKRQIIALFDLLLICNYYLPDLSLKRGRLMEKGDNINSGISEVLQYFLLHL